VIYDSANAYIRHDGQSNHWKRNDGYNSNDEKHGDWAYYGLIGDRTPIKGMESFAFNMGWVIAATILPSVVAFMVCPRLFPVERQLMIVSECGECKETS